MAYDLSGGYSVLPKVVARQCQSDNNFRCQPGARKCSPSSRPEPHRSPAPPTRCARSPSSLRNPPSRASCRALVTRPISSWVRPRTTRPTLVGRAQFPDDPTTSGFNVEVGLLAEPICGIKIDFIFAPWSECWTAKPESVYFDQATEYVGESLYKGYVHGCTAYTHTKGERNWSLEFTHSILAGLKTGGIITRLVRHCPHQQASAHAVVHCPFCDVWSGIDGRSCIPRRTGRRWQPGRLADDVQLHRHQARRRAGLGAHSWDLRLQQELLRRRRAAVHWGARAHVQKGQTPHVDATHTAWRAHGSPKRSLWPFLWADELHYALGRRQRHCQSTRCLTARSTRSTFMPIRLALPVLASAWLGTTQSDVRACPTPHS